MPYAKARSQRDRREADLLVNVVLAHMAFHNARDATRCKIERERFKAAVLQFHDFVLGVDPQMRTLATPHSP